eukprot:m.216584 g.216584  ORF g.216584 m.216584 type:complete len:759 (+) comp54103_c0_seq10:278-2554(+)
MAFRPHFPAKAKTGPRAESKIVFQLISETSCLAVFPFNSALQQIMQAQSAVFNPQLKGWLFPLGRYETILTQIAKAHVSLEVDPVPANVLAIFKPPYAAPPFVKTLDVTLTAEEFSSKLKSRVGIQLLSKLMPFQRAGTLSAIQRGGRVLLGDEMGLGKTLQALAVALHYQDDWPLLIICPSSLRHNWAAEIRKWLGLDSSSVQIVTSSSQGFRGLVSIVSYDLMSRMGEEATKKKFKIIIADESHFFKDTSTKRAKVVMPLLKLATRAILITGTPALSRPMELYSQLHSLQPAVFKTPLAFGRRYCNGFEGPFGWDFTGSSNLMELNTVLKHTVFIRRLKADVLTELPPKMRHRIMIEPCPKLKPAIFKMMKQLQDLQLRSRISNPATRLATEQEKRLLMTKLYHETGAAKVPAALEFIDDALAKYTKIIVFAHHQHVLDEIMAHLAKTKVRHIRIDGATPQQLRLPHCDNFQSDPVCRAALLSITAAGVGLTLHAANCVIFTELFWNPGQLLQAEDRAHRVGQQRTVDIKYLICPGTLDDAQWLLVQKKLSIVGQSINGKSDHLKIDEGMQHRALDQAKLDLSLFRPPGSRSTDRGATGSDPTLAVNELADLDAFIKEDLEVGRDEACSDEDGWGKQATAAPMDPGDDFDDDLDDLDCFIEDPSEVSFESKRPRKALEAGAVSGIDGPSRAAPLTTVSSKKASETLAQQRSSSSFSDLTECPMCGAAVGSADMAAHAAECASSLTSETWAAEEDEW